MDDKPQRQDDELGAGQAEYEAYRAAKDHASKCQDGTLTSAQNTISQPGENGDTYVQRMSPGQDLIQEQRALRRRWPSTQKRRNSLMNQMFRLVEQADRPHLQARAASVILAAERADNQLICSQTAAQARRDVGPAQVNVQIQVAAREAAVFGDVVAIASANAAARAQIDAIPKTPQLQSPTEDTSK